MSASIEKSDDLERNASYWKSVSLYSRRVMLPDSTTDLPFCCPVSCPAISASRAFSLIDMAWAIRDIQDGYSQSQAASQRRVDAAVVAKACAELLRLGNASLRAQGELRGVRLTEPRAALSAMDIDMASAWQSKFESWVKHLSNTSIPLINENVWEAWEDAKWGIYIEVSPKLRADIWLGFLVSLKFPTTKMVLKREPMSVQEESDLDACILLSIGQNGPLNSAASPRGVDVKHRGDRPACYLHIANEDEIVTDHTGPAFETSGLKALMLAIRITSVAVHGRKE